MRTSVLIYCVVATPSVAAMLYVYWRECMIVRPIAWGRLIRRGR